MQHIAIFASGNGTNAQRIVEYFIDSVKVNICRIYSNKPDALVLKRAANFGIPTTVFSRYDFYHSDEILHLLEVEKIDLIVLAGFLWLIPENLLKAFPNRIINIHPALLPKYGGKGMYGMRVHEAVIKSGDKKSGITIHLVNEKYDEGRIIRQVKCPVLPDDTPESLATKVHALEYQYFPRVIENVLSNISSKS